jgi:SAM-dependent methyltransferase
VQIAIGNRDRADPVLREYLENYDQIAEQDLDVGILDEQYVRNLAKNLVRVVGDVRGKDVLDVGVGKGYVLQELLARGVRSATAVDISLEYLQRLAPLERIRCVQANAENLPFESEFDVLLTTDVMEHVLNVGSFLVCANRALRQDGRLVVRVPYRESLLPYSPKQGCLWRFVHLRTFNKDTLRDYLDCAGFSVERLVFDGYVTGHPHQLWSREQRRMDFYVRFTDWLVERYGSVAHATLLPRWLVGIFMPPLELIAVARKVASLKVSEASGVLPRAMT